MPKIFFFIQTFFKNKFSLVKDDLKTLSYCYKILKKSNKTFINFLIFRELINAHYLGFFVYYSTFVGHILNIPSFIGCIILQQIILKNFSNKKLFYYNVLFHKDFFKILKIKNTLLLPPRIKKGINPIKISYYLRLAKNKKQYTKLYNLAYFNILSADFYENTFKRFDVNFFLK